MLTYSEKLAKKNAAPAKTARFWVYHYPAEGWVKLALQDGETLWHRSGGPCDEGYSYTTVEWKRDGDLIRRETWTTARDCDGRHEYIDVSVCPIDQLMTERRDDNNGEGMWLPNWESEDSHQRDHTAEAAGY